MYIHIHVHVLHVHCMYHGKYVYSTLALEKERKIVKEDTAFRKEKEAVYSHVQS